MNNFDKIDITTITTREILQISNKKNLRKQSANNKQENFKNIREIKQCSK